MPLEDFLQIWEDAKDMGVLLGKGGLYGTVSILQFLLFNINFCLDAIFFFQGK